VHRATSKNGTYTAVKTITSGNTLSFTNTSLATNKAYYYKIRAYTTVGTAKVYGSYTAVVNAKPVPAKPGSPKATAIAGGAKVSWKAETGVCGYEVWRSTSSKGTYTNVKTLLGGATASFNNTGLSTGTTYFYKIRAYTTVGSAKVYGPYSEVVSAKPAVPYKLTYNANGGSVSPGSKNLIANESYGTLPRPTRPGYTFLGWFTAKSGGKEVSSSTKMPAGNVTIYARWKEGVDPNAELVGTWSCITERWVNVEVRPYFKYEWRMRWDSYKFNSNGTFEYYPYEGYNIFKGAYFVSNGKLNLRNIKCYNSSNPDGDALYTIPDKVMEYQLGKDKDGEYLMIRSMYLHLSDTSVGMNYPDKYLKG